MIDPEHIALIFEGFALGVAFTLLIFGLWLPFYTDWILTHEDLPERRGDGRR